MADTYLFPGQPGSSARAVRLTIPKDQAALLRRPEVWTRASSDGPRTANLPTDVLDSLKDHYFRTYGSKSALRQAAGSPNSQGSEGENVPTHAVAAAAAEAGATEEEGTSVAAASKEGATGSFQEATQEGASADDDNHSLDRNHIQSSPERFPSSWTPSPTQGQHKPVEAASSPGKLGTPSRSQQQIVPPSSLDFEEELEVVVPHGIRDTARAASRGPERNIPSSSPRYTSTHPPPCGQGDRVMPDADSTPEVSEEVAAKPEAMEKPVPGRRRRRMQQPHFSSDPAAPQQVMYPGNRLATARIPPAKVNALDMDSSQASGKSPTPMGMSPGPMKRHYTRASNASHGDEPLAKKHRTFHEVNYETARESSHSTEKKPRDTGHGEHYMGTHKMSPVKSRAILYEEPHDSPRNASHSASPKAVHDASHEATHEIPLNAYGVELYDTSAIAPREPCSGGSNRGEVLVPATPSASLPQPATIGHDILQTVEHVKPYDAYTTQYPGYQGTVWDFMRACVCLNYMQQRDMLREFLYDDFIRAFQEEYPYYVVEFGGDLPAQQWFNRLRGPVVFRNMVITRDTLQQVFQAYPEVYRGVENGRVSPLANEAARKSLVSSAPVVDHRPGSVQELIQPITPTPRERPAHAPYTAQQASRTASTVPVISGKTPSTAPAGQRVSRKELETIRDRGSPVGMSSQVPLVIPATQPLEPSMSSSQRPGLVSVPGSQAQRNQTRDPRAVNLPTSYSAIAESPLKPRTPLARPGSSTLPHGHPSSEKSSRTDSRAEPVSAEKGTRPPDPRVSTPATAPAATMQRDSLSRADRPQTPTTAPVVKTEDFSPRLADLDVRHVPQSTGKEAPAQPTSNGSPEREASNPVSPSSSSGSWAPARPVASPAAKGGKPRRSRPSVTSRQSAEEIPDRRASNGSSARGAMSLASRHSAESSSQREAVVSSTTKCAEPRHARPSVAAGQSPKEKSPNRRASKGNSADDAASRTSHRSTEPSTQGETEMVLSPAGKGVEPRRPRLSDSTGTRSPDLGVSADPSPVRSKKSRAGTHTPAGSSLSPVQSQPKEKVAASKTKGKGTGQKKAKVEGGRVEKKKNKSRDGESSRKPRISRVDAMRIYLARKRAAESASTSPASKV